MGATPLSGGLRLMPALDASSLSTLSWHLSSPGATGAGAEPGVVTISGRKVRLAGPETEGEPSLYALARAWVRNDPSLPLVHDPVAIPATGGMHHATGDASEAGTRGGAGSTADSESPSPVEAAGTLHDDDINPDDATPMEDLLQDQRTRWARHRLVRRRRAAQRAARAEPLLRALLEARVAEGAAAAAEAEAAAAAGAPEDATPAPVEPVAA